jgi:hypothetical protein
VQKFLAAAYWKSSRWEESSQAKIGALRNVLPNARHVRVRYKCPV